MKPGDSSGDHGSDDDALWGLPAPSGASPDAPARKAARFFGDRRFGNERRFLYLVVPAVVLFSGGIFYCLIALHPAKPTPAAPEPSPRAEAPANPATGLIETGTQALQTGDYAGAEASFRAALASDPASASAKNNLAVSLILQGQNDEAAGLLEEVLASAPGNPGTRANLAQALRASGHLEKAIAHLTAASHEDPFNTLLSNRLLLAKIQAGKIGEVRATIASTSGLGLSSLESGQIMAKAALAAADGDMEGCLRALARASEILDTPTRRLLLNDPVLVPYHGAILGKSDPAGGSR